MEMSGEATLNASRNEVWAALNDPEILRQSIPGCETLSKATDNEFTAAVVLKVGPIKTKFVGRVTLSEVNPSNGYTISGKGEGGIAGFAEGSARVRLEEIDAARTILHYAVDAKVGGKIAQLGARLIDSTAAKLAGQFFRRFGELVEAARSQATETTPGRVAV